MEDQKINFETAKLAKEKGFHEESSCNLFYAEPNSKIYGIDYRDRYYPIKNTPQKLYTIGEHAVINAKNIILAPTQSLLQKWLRERHSIIVEPTYDFTGSCRWNCVIIQENREGKYCLLNAGSFEECLESGLMDALNLIP